MLVTSGNVVLLVHLPFPLPFGPVLACVNNNKIIRAWLELEKEECSYPKGGGHANSRVNISSHL